MTVTYLRAVVLTALSLCSTAALAFDYFLVNDDSAVYAAPESQEVLTRLHKGSVLLQIDQQGAWSKVFFLSADKQPLKGWMLSDTLRPQQQGSRADNTLIVSVKSLRLRQGPGTEYPVVGSLTQHQQVAERQREGDWVKISYRNQAGNTLEAWTAGRFLRSSASLMAANENASEERPTTARVSSATGVYQVGGTHVNFRSGPGTEFSVVGKLNAPQRVEAIKQQHGWLNIRVEQDGRLLSGWILKRLLKPVN
ncbi:SH3 domain-containing protein [Amphritea sp. 1_MG-2023]|uniref:SH3 domain-containing protein n=1 Tax=Amphritea sp. 1_MG-2023 TaxID=3062670 RepID=UPI0026E3219C|nr:SH3 domain-containing protein [Amphritea sp. 1_MG-2023]MDO6562173.1 SH3 domain-containing protein [Amphritea sp. 1_MG-2023]